LLVAKLSAGRAQDLIDVDALRESDQSREIEPQRRPDSSVTSARNELDQIKQEGREDSLRQREQKGSSPAPEEVVSGSPDNGLDDDPNLPPSNGNCFDGINR
jgi:hypothetical protein